MDFRPRHSEQFVVIDGFSKSHAMTGWRVGWIHGPKPVIDAVTMMQQYTFVCEPQPGQWAAVEETLIVVPGSVFGRADTHFRIASTVSDRTLDRGIAALVRLAGGR